MELEKYSIGIGDRFAKQGRAQLRALVEAKKRGVDIVPVWNKSYREHSIIGTSPEDVRMEADDAILSLDWNDSCYVDADHIGLSNVDLFIDSSNFFTLDVADFTGQAASDVDVQAFVDKHSRYVGALNIPGIDEPIDVSAEQIKTVAEKYLLAVKEAGKIYRHVASKKGASNFVTEVSMDETDDAQTPVEMFFILAAIADEGIPAQTIAPKFAGRFNKSVDYVGDVAQFTSEFNDDLAVIAFAISEFGLPSNLKLSVHSGSDKFSIYGPMRDAIRKFDAGLHIKTAGTTWLEELAGLALAGGEGLEIAAEIYGSALNRIDELCNPYATVIDINRDNLPTAEEVKQWSGVQYAAALQHDQACESFNPDLRQLLHVGYKVAAEMGDRYLMALVEFEKVVGDNVTYNILERHIARLFL